MQIPPVKPWKALSAVAVAYVMGAVSYSLFNGDLLFIWVVLSVFCG